MVMRDKYCATTIISENIQEVLKKVRDRAEYYDVKIVDVFDDIGRADAATPQPLLSHFNWGDDRLPTLNAHVHCRDSFNQLHDRLVGMAQRWTKGVRYSLRSSGSKQEFDPAVEGEEGLVRLLNATIGAVAQESTAKFFNSYGREHDGGYEFIYDLREILDLQWDYATVEIIEEEEVAA